MPVWQDFLDSPFRMATCSLCQHLVKKTIKRKHTFPYIVFSPFLYMPGHNFGIFLFYCIKRFEIDSFVPYFFSKQK